jgi:hypothetical protein
MLTSFAKAHAAALQLDPDLAIQPAGIHPSFHVDENGQLLVELVAQWIQTPKTDDRRRVEIGGVALRAGTTAIFAADGRVRYIATRPLPGSHLGNDTQREVADRRVDGFRQYAAALDARDPLQLWSDRTYADQRMIRRANFTFTHHGLGSWGSRRG